MEVLRLKDRDEIAFELFLTCSTHNPPSVSGVWGWDRFQEAKDPIMVKVADAKQKPVALVPGNQNRKEAGDLLGDSVSLCFSVLARTPKLTKGEPRESARLQLPPV